MDSCASHSKKPGDFTPLRIDLFLLLRVLTFFRGRVNLGSICIYYFFHRLDGNIVHGRRRAPRIHLRQGAHRGESHIDYALDAFSKRFVGAGHSLKGKKKGKLEERDIGHKQNSAYESKEPMQKWRETKLSLPLNPMTEE